MPGGQLAGPELCSRPRRLQPRPPRAALSQARKLPPSPLLSAPGERHPFHSDLGGSHFGGYLEM